MHAIATTPHLKLQENAQYGDMLRSGIRTTANYLRKIQMDSKYLVWVCVVRVVTAIIALLISFELATEGKEGWGWFLFAAIMLGCFSIKD